MSCKKRTLGLSPKELRQSIQYAINNRDRAKHHQIWLHAFIFENWLNPGPNIFFNHTLPSVFDTLGESSTIDKHLSHAAAPPVNTKGSSLRQRRLYGNFFVYRQIVT